MKIVKKNSAYNLINVKPTTCHNIVQLLLCLSQLTD